MRRGHNSAPDILGAGEAWTAWVERWHATSTLTPRVRAVVRTIMAKAGRWLAAEHPEITEPAQWTRQTCAAWVAAVDRMSIGAYVQRHEGFADRTGKPISPRTKAHFLMASRTFFRDCQEWEWFPRRFDPSRAMALPRSVAALIGTNPRVIADEVWAKLLWAGLNLQEDDLLTWELGLLPNRTGPRRYLDLAVRWASQRRDSSAASRLCPLATRWLSHIGRLARSPRRRCRVLAGRARPQDRHRVHQTGRPIARPGHRVMASTKAGTAQKARPQDERARRLALCCSCPTCG